MSSRSSVFPDADTHDSPLTQDNREWIRLREATRLSSPNVLRRDRQRINANEDQKGRGQILAI